MLQAAYLVQEEGFLIIGLTLMQACLAGGDDAVVDDFSSSMGVLGGEVDTDSLAEDFFIGERYGDEQGEGG